MRTMFEKTRSVCGKHQFTKLFQSDMFKAFDDVLMNKSGMVLIRFQGDSTGISSAFISS